MDKSNLYDLGKELEKELDNNKREFWVRLMNGLLISIGALFIIGFALYMMDNLTNLFGLELNTTTEKLLFLILVLAAYLYTAITTVIEQRTSRITLRQAIIIKLLTRQS